MNCEKGSLLRAFFVFAENKNEKKGFSENKNEKSGMNRGCHMPHGVCDEAIAEQLLFNGIEA